MAVLKVVSGMHIINKSTLRAVVLTKQIKFTKEKESNRRKGEGVERKRISCSGLGLHSICLLKPIRVTLDCVT